MYKFHVVNYEADKTHHPVTALSRSLEEACRAKNQFIANLPYDYDDGPVVLFAHWATDTQWAQYINWALSVGVRHRRVVILCSSNPEVASRALSEYCRVSGTDPEDENLRNHVQVLGDVEQFTKNYLADFVSLAANDVIDVSMLRKHPLPENVIAAYLLRRAGMDQTPDLASVKIMLDAQAEGAEPGKEAIFIENWFASGGHRCR